jgi:hypothetical protein
MLSLASALDRKFWGLWRKTFGSGFSSSQRMADYGV